MERIICLLLITLLFADCKKAKNTKNEVTIKGKWEAKEIKTEYYDSYGKPVYTEIKSDLYMVTFDDNKVTFTNNKQTRVCPYAYQNGYLTIFDDNISGNNTKALVSEITVNSMCWQFESDDTCNIQYRQKPQAPLQPAAKVIIYINFTKQTQRIRTDSIALNTSFYN